jgi:hypothetical protein
MRTAAQAADAWRASMLTAKRDGVDSDEYHRNLRAEIPRSAYVAGRITLEELERWLGEIYTA